MEPPVIGALVSSTFACVIAAYSLYITRRTRKTETTRDLLRRYFSVEFTLVRRESIPALKTFYELRKSGSDTDSSDLIRYLVNSALDKYQFSEDRTENKLSSQQNTLLFLYYWAELEAYRRRDLLDLPLVKEILISQWELYHEVLSLLLAAYEKAVTAKTGKLSPPPWVPAIRTVGEWMGLPS